MYKIQNNIKQLFTWLKNYSLLILRLWGYIKPKPFKAEKWKRIEAKKETTQIENII